MKKEEALKLLKKIKIEEQSLGEGVGSVPKEINNILDLGGEGMGSVPKGFNQSIFKQIKGEK